MRRTSLGELRKRASAGPLRPAFEWYRYAWAERAETCGYPERFAQEALGHNSKAVHRAYAKNAQVILPHLEDYEREFATIAAIPNPSADGI